MYYSVHHNGEKAIFSIFSQPNLKLAKHHKKQSMEEKQSPKSGSTKQNRIKLKQIHLRLYSYLLFSKHSTRNMNLKWL